MSWLILGLLFSDLQRSCAYIASRTRISMTSIESLNFSTRESILKSATVAASTLIVNLALPTFSKENVNPKVYFDVRIMELPNESNGYSSSSAPTGVLVMELFGNEAPKTVQNFLSYIRSPESNSSAPKNAKKFQALDESGPSYATSTFTHIVPNKFLDGGKIPGLDNIFLAGSSQLQYDGRIFPAILNLESNSLLHSKRGLLSKTKLDVGPEFCITLGPCPELDASNIIFGQIIGGLEFLNSIEEVPIITSGSTQKEGSFADNLYRAQKSASLFVGQNVLRDERAVDRTGTFLRKIEVVRCGTVPLY